MRNRPFVRLVKAAVCAAVFAAPALTLTATTADAQGLGPLWTGAYLGFHGGGTWSDIDVSNIGSADTSAFSGGGHAGYNFAFGRVIVGIEGDLNYDGSEFAFASTVGDRANLEVDWSSTLRGRIGLPVGPALLYATAGFAWTDRTLATTSAAGTTSSSSHTFNGVAYGIGAEAFVLPNLSLRLEALRYDYAAENLSFGGAAAAVEEFDPSETVVRAGVTFHLN